MAVIGIMAGWHSQRFTCSNVVRAVSPHENRLLTANLNIPTQRCGAVGFLRLQAREDVKKNVHGLQLGEKLSSDQQYKISMGKTRRDVLLSAAALSTVPGCASLPTRSEPATNPTDSCDFSGASWPSVGQSHTRTNTIKETPLPNQPTLQRIPQPDQLAGTVKTEPVIAGDTVFAAGNAGIVIARGEHDWTWRSQSDSTISVSPTVTCNYVFVQTSKGVVALNQADGTESWGKPAQRFASNIIPVPPTTVESTLYLCSDRLYAIDIHSSETQWHQSPPDQDVPRGLAATDEEVLVTFGFSEGPYSVVCYESDGTKRWEERYDTRYMTRPAIDDGAVYFATDAGLHKRDLQSGNERWQLEANIGKCLDVAVDDSMVVFWSASQSICRAVDTDSGKISWETSFGRAVESPAIVNETLLVPVDNLPSNISTQITSTTQSSTTDGSSDEQVTSGLCAFDLKTGDFDQLVSHHHIVHFAVTDNAIFGTGTDSTLWKLA
ncbi:hypothetical protein DVK04_18045 [Haloferax sp. Atlit-105R]|nr:hypothetical protein DEQ67_15115 [Haloferax sp. Atlit-48N]RDZ34369.1 hypothetical protein C5B88_15205 [Haloferax sp. Atlit-24N]RLM40816.1 hypothetical protein DVK04_18045 [Haloferax sp. Atlit-105R]